MKRANMLLFPCKIIFGYLLIPLIYFMAFLNDAFCWLFGWRWADCGWTFKWYVKTEHGRNLEKKIGAKIHFWEFLEKDI